MKQLLTVILVAIICNMTHFKSIKQIKEVAVKEYLQHPENYAIQHVHAKGDTISSDIIVTYLK